jgi:HPt (histidine-containing phosphotransfer) domain-containing protein
MDTVIATAQPASTRELLDRLWQRSLPLLCERLDVLDAAAAASHAEIPIALRTQAIAEAHKLAGSLGMFGYPSATDLSREIETLLEAPGNPDAALLTKFTTDLRAILFPSS